MFEPIALFYADGYKVGHPRMLAPKTSRLYGTWIPRSLKRANKAIKKILSFGQQLTVRWLHDEFQEHFFKLPLNEALKFGKDMSLYLGQEYNSSHFESLHRHGRLPIRIKSLPEGIETNPNVPHMTFINTVDGFAWLTLYLETVISSLAWVASTSATTALQYRRNAIKWVMKTDPSNAWLIDFMCHDFSARGLSPYDMIASGLGHATSHKGSDTLITIPAARYFYNEPADKVCIYSVNASEHSVSTTKIFTVGEQKMLSDWMKEFPSGILSVVMDTMDLTRVVKPVQTGYLFELKNEIMNRNGKLVIRPDSSPETRTPADIICGHDLPLTDRELQADYPEFYHKGLIECLWDIFGGTTNNEGYKVLDPHIGAIYGDSITLDRQEEIYARLAAKGFAATNIVLGVGSYQYRFVTRDTFGFAAKGSWFECDGKGYDMYKDPITDGGTKKSLKGLIQVTENLEVKTECSWEEEAKGILQVIYENGYFFNETSLEQVRERVKLLN